jgi:hypothetical protein
LQGFAEIGLSSAAPREKAKSRNGRSDEAPARHSLGCHFLDAPIGFGSATIQPDTPRWPDWMNQRSKKRAAISTTEVV